jgi:hypothetical protein
MKDKKKKHRQVAAAKLLAVYANLAHFKRDLLQEMLSKHAFLCVEIVSTLIGLSGTNAIRGRLTRGCWRTSPRMGLTLDMSGPEEIAMENWSAETVREVILDFIRKLVSFRSLNSSSRELGFNNTSLTPHGVGCGT